MEKILKRIYEIELRQDTSVSEIYWDWWKRKQRVLGNRKGPLIRFVEDKLQTPRPGKIHKYYRV